MNLFIYLIDDIHEFIYQTYSYLQFIEKLIKTLGKFEIQFAYM